MPNDKIKKATDKKMKILETSDDVFFDDIKSLQTKIKTKVLRLLKSFSSNGKNIDKGKANQSLLLSLGRELNSIIKTSTFASSTKKFLRNFDVVEDLGRTILNDIDGVDMNKLDFGVEKQLAIEEIVDGLLNQQMLKVGLVKPIRKILFRHITTGISLEDAENEITNFIDGNENAGFVEKYVKTLAKSSLTRYDGIINQRAAIEFDLDGFSIVGSLIKTSQLSCREMVRGAGSFKHLEVNNKYRIEDIPKIIDIIKTRPGFIKGTNPDNYFINGNHWGCRHSFIPTRLLERDKIAFAAKGLT